MRSFKKEGFFFWFGLILIAGYWLWLRPPGFGRLGYVEDLGSIELSRQLMADGIREFGRPTFTTSRMMAPYGITTAFYSWSLERDWIGAYFWLWDRDFPWLWFYFGISLLISFMGVGKILRSMGLNKVSAWILSTVVVLFNIPRHFTVYYHYEYLPQHWFYLGIFMDAWIWQRFYREKKISWVLEIWRGFCLLGVFGLTGYFWGPTILEYALVRAGMGLGFFFRHRKGIKTKIEGTWKRATRPLVLCLVLFILDLRWFLPLVSEVRKLGPVWQPLGWLANIPMVFRPLWLEKFMDVWTWFLPASGRAVTSFLTQKELSPVDWPETIVTVGWIYWVPALLGIYLLARKKGRATLRAVLPQLIFLLIIVLYVRRQWLPGYQSFLRAVIPFMAYFRVASRMGIFFPATLGAIIALSWPELSAWAESKWKARGAKRRKYHFLFGVFAVSCVAEVLTLGTPTITMPPMGPSLKTLLGQVRDLPGTTVLDLPFCVAGGNGYCTGEQCPNYPDSTAPAIFTGWHDKKVFGVYEARLVPAQCEIYNRAPYTSWFDAWKQNRCFTEPEWKAFCGYVTEHRELSSILVYPDIWKAAGTSECQAQFEKYLGRPIAHADFFISIKRGGVSEGPNRVFRYTASCLGAF